MSRPGYPAVYFHDEVRKSHSIHYDGTRTDHPDIVYSVTTAYIDKIGPNTLGWPVNYSENPFKAHGWAKTPKLGPYLDLSFVPDNPGPGQDTYNTMMPLAAITDALTLPPENANHAYCPEDAEALSSNRERVIEKLQSRIKNQRVNVGQIIGERKQVVSMVASTARRLAESLTHLKRGNWRSAQKSLLGSGSQPSTRHRTRVSENIGGVPEQWLALQYGWKPLIKDIYGACEELADKVTGSPVVCHAYASATTQLNLPEIAVYTHVPGTNYPPSFYMKRVKAQVRGSGFLQFGISASLGQDLSRLGIANPYHVAWELLPYSFVVDWFLPVGNFLSNLDYETGLVFQRGWLSQKVTTTWQGGIKSGKHSNGTQSVSYLDQFSSWTQTNYDREIFSAAPLVSPPRFKDPLSLGHMANALSLLAVAFGKPDNFRIPR